MEEVFICGHGVPNIADHTDPSGNTTDVKVIVKNRRKSSTLNATKSSGYLIDYYLLNSTTLTVFVFFPGVSLATFLAGIWIVSLVWGFTLFLALLSAYTIYE